MLVTFLKHLLQPSQLGCCALFVVCPTDIFTVFSGIKPLGLGLDTTSVLSAINSVSGAKTDGSEITEGDLI